MTSLSLPGPLIFSSAALILAAISFGLHRWRWFSGTVAAVGSLCLGWMAWQATLGTPISMGNLTIDLEQSFTLLGRSWGLSITAAAPLAAIWLLGGLVFLLALPASQGWAFYPFGLAVLGVLGLSLMAQEPLYAVLLFWMAACLSVFVLVGGRPGTTIGALRFLSITTIGVIPLLILPHFSHPETVATAVGLMTLGFGILFMMPPFHGQLISIGAFASPMAPAFFLSTFSLITMAMLARQAAAFPMLIQDSLFFDLARWSGIGAIVLGGVGAAGQRRWGSLIGYAALVDWGVGLVTLGQGSEAGLELATQMLIRRSLCLILACGGFIFLFKANNGRDDLEHCTGMLRRRPLNISSMVIGILGLGGLPLPADWGSRSRLFSMLIDASALTAWLIALGGIGVTIGVGAGVWSCLGSAPQNTPQERRQSMLGLIFGLLALGIVGRIWMSAAPWMGRLEAALTAFLASTG